MVKEGRALGDEKQKSNGGHDAEPLVQGLEALATRAKPDCSASQAAS